MDFITLTDLTTDNVLTPTQEDVNLANTYVAGIASSLGVTADALLQPAGVAVKRLGELYAYSTKALSMVGSDPTVNMDGSRTDDLYKQKYELYKEALADHLASLKASDFTGKSEDGEGGGMGYIPLYRA